MGKNLKKTEHVTGRVDTDAIKNISTIAAKLGWSFNKTLNEAMLRLKSEDIIADLEKKPGS
jgi:hypothetical protein